MLKRYQKHKICPLLLDRIWFHMNFHKFINLNKKFEKGSQKNLNNNHFLEDIIFWNITFEHTLT